ncbi:helix-turn-helix transcriptional regulator [uncultured Roseobacter sp.]|uniref:helix-turn-helix domain-containing protein n=1 Tax=uncultured Roseobacter sp. TaxID=114847 RepID=UPI002606D66A|nr:helix-turn-helix transcriptional regulator [uncultured Roseobacter sp.]
MNIQELRRDRGLSQEALAHAAEINRGYFGKLENAKYAVSVDMLEKIAEALDVDPSALLKPR